MKTIVLIILAMVVGFTGCSAGSPTVKQVDVDVQMNKSFFVMAGIIDANEKAVITQNFR